MSSLKKKKTVIAIAIVSAIIAATLNQIVQDHPRNTLIYWLLSPIEYAGFISLMIAIGYLIIKSEKTNQP